MSVGYDFRLAPPGAPGAGHGAPFVAAAAEEGVLIGGGGGGEGGGGGLIFTKVSLSCFGILS